MERLASFSRLVTTDRRGLGCSDRLPPGQAPTLEEHVDDLILVMEAAYASPATIFAGVETAFIALLAAAAHPGPIQQPRPVGPLAELAPFRRSAMGSVRGRDRFDVELDPEGHEPAGEASASRAGP